MAEKDSKPPIPGREIIDIPNWMKPEKEEEKQNADTNEEQ